MIHGLFSLAAVLLVFAFSLPVHMAFFVPFFYMGREHAQAEYRYIQSHGGHRADCPWYCGFLPSAWTVKGLLDFVIPLLIAVAYAVLSMIFKH